MNNESAPTPPTHPPIVTADGLEVIEFDTVFNYYDMTVVTILGDVDAEGWFHVEHINHLGQRVQTLLNGERICSLGHAARMGWLVPNPKKAM